jgi:hypothetical protein
MRKNVVVNWNQQYRNLRAQILSELDNKPKVVLLRKVFADWAADTLKTFGGKKFEDNGEFHRAVRALMAEVSVKVVIGQQQVAITRMHVVKIEVDQWPAIIENGVRRVIEYMNSRNSKVTECGMTIEQFKNLMTFWPNTPVFNMRLQAEFREHGLGFQHNKTTVVVRKLRGEDAPRMQLHNGRTLLHILCTPVITQKRRWAKGYTHAITVNETSLIGISEPINDENNEPLNAIAMGRDNVLLVNEPALQIISRAFEQHPDDIIVRQL